ncbi:MAG: DNA repair protein RecN [Gammaproteobacteria bacterium]|nr:DNA repair protein RecN [Gammaproteobacteria bacterium]
MLRHIHVRNFAIIDEVQLELSPGLTVMTGETGAGKSILVDALSLLLGERVGNEVIRPGAERAELEALFSLDNSPEAQRWLREHAIDDESGECLVRRVIAREGSNRAYVNGRGVNLSTLRELGGLLVDIHGQHEHQNLLKPGAQRELLDGFGGHEALLARVSEAFAKWRATAERLKALRQADDNRSQRIELLRYQVEELTALRLEPNEWERIEAEHRRLTHAGRLIELCQNALEALYEGEGETLHGSLTHINALLEQGRRTDAGLEPALELLRQAEILLHEGVDQLRDYARSLELDPERLAEVESRLTALHDAARKYRVRPEELPQLARQLAEELAKLEGEGESLEALEERLLTQEAVYREAARALSHARTETAARLSAHVTASIRGLGMPHARFAIQVTPREDKGFTAHGLDTVEMLVSTNPGQPLQALGKVASGGELSRISLALRVATAVHGQVATLVFDEVDTGIGGSVAEVVGRLLASLGRQRQVLCVTHLPQVAAQGHHHLHVRKEQSADSTHTQLIPLDREARIEELARMMGGVEITAQTRGLAQEMLERAAGGGAQAALEL